MTQINQQIELPAIAQTIQKFASSVVSAQTEVSEKLIEVNRHWLEHMLEESHELQEVVRKLSGSVPLNERMTSIQEWFKGVAERSAKETTYAFEAASALRDIELKHLTSGLQQHRSS
jgi:hypothetical protein